jgi:hypothetical protein
VRCKRKQVPRLRIAIDEANRNAPLGMTVLDVAIDEANRNAPLRMTRVLLPVFFEAHLIPKSVNTLGFSSPVAKNWWHAPQSFVIVWPSALV